MNIRQSDYKLLTLHGLLNPNVEWIYKYRNDFYYIGGIQLKQKNADDTNVRLLGYKVPLKAAKKGGKFIALLGYDERFNPYIFEMKSERSDDELQKVIDDLNKREKIVATILDNISKEVSEKLFWKGFKLTNDIKKVVLAHRKYFDDKPLKSQNYTDIMFCAFDNWGGTDALIKQIEGKGFIEVDVL